MEEDESAAVLLRSFSRGGGGKKWNEKRKLPLTKARVRTKAYIYRAVCVRICVVAVCGGGGGGGRGARLFVLWPDLPMLHSRSNSWQ